MGKVLTRPQMRRAAMACMELAAQPESNCLLVAKDWGVPADEINVYSPRGMGSGFCTSNRSASRQCRMEASILLSEAVRPAGHDGEG